MNMLLYNLQAQQNEQLVSSETELKNDNSKTTMKTAIDVGIFMLITLVTISLIAKIVEFIDRTPYAADDISLDNIEDTIVIPGLTEEEYKKVLASLTEEEQKEFGSSSLLHCKGGLEMFRKAKEKNERIKQEIEAVIDREVMQPARKVLDKMDKDIKELKQQLKNEQQQLKNEQQQLKKTCMKDAEKIFNQYCEKYKNEIQNIESEHQYIKSGCQYVKSQHQYIKSQQENIKSEHQDIKSEIQNIKSQQENIKSEIEKLNLK